MTESQVILEMETQFSGTIKTTANTFISLDNCFFYH